MNTYHALWLFLYRWPLAWLCHYGVTIEPDGDHDNVLCVIYTFLASYRRQVLPVALLMFTLIVTFVYLLTESWTEGLIPAASVAFFSYYRGWRVFPFFIIVSQVPHDEGSPMSFEDYKAAHPNASLEEWLFNKPTRRRSDITKKYSKAQHNMFTFHLRKVLRSYGIRSHQYVLVSGLARVRVAALCEPEARFRASLIPHVAEEDDPFDAYKSRLASFLSHMRQIIYLWHDHNMSYDMTFHRWCDEIAKNRWMFVISGGPLTEVEQLCHKSSNVISCAMAWSWDTSKNLFRQNANVLFNPEAAMAVTRFAWLHVAMDTSYIKTHGPRFVGDTPRQSMDVFKKSMHGRIDPDTNLMYTHFTQRGGPTPWDPNTKHFTATT